MTDWPSIVASAATVLGVTASGLGTLWHWAWKRFDAVNAKVAECEKNHQAVQHKLSECENREAATSAKIGAITQFIKASFPIDPTLPPHLARMLEAIDHTLDGRKP